jgi:hypothetical protein
MAPWHHPPRRAIARGLSYLHSISLELPPSDIYGSHGKPTIAVTLHCSTLDLRQQHAGLHLGQQSIVNPPKATIQESKPPPLPNDDPRPHDGV